MALLAIQFLIWTTTGLYMVSIDIDYIRGNSLITSEQKVVSLEQVTYSTNDLVKQYPNAKNIQLARPNTSEIYRFKLGGQKVMVDALTGERLPPLNQLQARQIAEFYYSGNQAISSIRLLTKPEQVPAELSSRHLPFWQVKFDHYTTPTLYIDQNSARIITKRHNYWRIFDWMWRFHIMDYDDGENVANWLLLLIASLGVIASLCGVVLTYSTIFRNKKSKSLMKISPRLNRAVHKWLSLLVGIQLLIWLGTGLYFNLMDTELASGNANRIAVNHQASWQNFELLPVSQLPIALPIETDLIWILKKPYYHHVYNKTAHNYQLQTARLFDAQTGEKITLTEAQIKQIALQSYTGSGNLKTIGFNKPPFADYLKQENQMWQVDIDDEVNTSIYLDKTTGRVLRHSNDDSRLKALMFKLHFMDYGNSGGFNHWLIIIFAIGAFIFAITGIIWLVQLYRKGLLKFTRD